jgi:hypothetical protein
MLQSGQTVKDTRPHPLLYRTFQLRRDTVLHGFETPNFKPDPWLKAVFHDSENTSLQQVR